MARRPPSRWKLTLDDPWLGKLLGRATPATTGLILLNTTIVFILAAVNAFAVDFPVNASVYIKNHTMLLRAELIFFWCTVPLVYLIVAGSENYFLWTDRLRPL